VEAAAPKWLNRGDKVRGCTAILSFFRAIGPIEVIALLIVAVLIVWPAGRICTKAGFSGLMGLMAIIPVLNVVLFYILAFAP
jgi:hypothetical protein